MSRLVLACTAPYLPPPEQWLERAATVREQGVEAIADAVIARWFTPAVRRTSAWRAQLASTPAEGYARCCEAIGGMDLRADLARIKVPTTVILGRARPGRRRRATGASSRSWAPAVELDAAHLANVEQPAAFNEAVLA